MGQFKGERKTAVNKKNIFLKFIYLLWERDRQSMSQGGTEREKGRENPKQSLLRQRKESVVRLDLVKLRDHNLS